MVDFFERKFSLRYFEMNKKGLASPTTILTLLEETAAEHCYEIDYSLYDLEKKNIGWVLVSGSIEMIRYPKYKEKIKIKTWLSNYSLVKGYRENLILDEKDTIIGKARGLWVFYDIGKRRPVPILEEIKLKWGYNESTSTQLNIDEKIRPIINSEPKAEFKVYKLDIDGNNHVNNIRYLHWLIESLPEELLDNYFLKSINGRFISEAKYGEQLSVYLEKGNSENDFFHTIKSNFQEKICATAHTVWEKY